MKKIILWSLVLLIVVFVSFFFYKYWEISNKWIGVIYLESDSFSHKEVGDFKSLEQCKIVMEARLKTNPITDNGTSADRFFCGRACLVDVFVGEFRIDEYQCSEKILSNSIYK
jgi:hypothetical protein